MGGHQTSPNGGNDVRNTPLYEFKGFLKFILEGDHGSPNTPYPDNGRGFFLGTKGIGKYFFIIFANVIIYL